MRIGNFGNFCLLPTTNFLAFLSDICSALVKPPLSRDPCVPPLGAQWTLLVSVYRRVLKLAPMEAQGIFFPLLKTTELIFQLSRGSFLCLDCERESRRGKATTCLLRFGFHCPGLAPPNSSPLLCWIRPHYPRIFFPCLDWCSVCFCPLNKEHRRTSLLTRRRVCKVCQRRQRRKEEKDKRERKILRRALANLAAKHRNQPVQVPVQVESESPQAHRESGQRTGKDSGSGSVNSPGVSPSEREQSSDSEV